MARRKKVRSCRGKRRYRDHAEAVRVLRGLKTYSTRDEIATRAYECHRCGGWHVTKRSN